MPLIDPVTMSTSPRPLNSLPAKTSLPIDLLPTDLARIYTHIHPILLVSTYYLRFPSLVADPVSSLLTSLIPLAIIQISYAAICLPAAGSTTTKLVKKAKPGSKKDASALGFQPFVRLQVSITYHICFTGWAMLINCNPTDNNTLPPPHPSHNPPPPNSPNPLWRAPNHAPPSHAPLLRPRLPPRPLSTNLRSRFLNPKMEGSFVGIQSVGRDVWRCGGCVSWGVGGCGADPVGLG